MREFDDKRADKAFLKVAALISKFRTKHPEITNEELAYALLQVCVISGDMNDTWFDFAREALDECISMECDAMAGIHKMDL